MKDNHAIAITVGAFAFIGAIALASYSIQTHITKAVIQVEGKERLLSISSDSDGKSSTKYKNYVYASDETYSVQDSFWNWHWRAGTVYASIPDGGAECSVTLAGYRWGFLSMHQNIIEADCKGS